MRSNFTIPSLQACLDELSEAQSIALARTQIERLFGHNDVAFTRLERFATGHNCIVSHADGCVVFRKMTPRP